MSLFIETMNSDQVNIGIKKGISPTKKLKGKNNIKYIKYSNILFQTQGVSLSFEKKGN
jgi:hypothetical protein